MFMFTLIAGLSITLVGCGGHEHLLVHHDAVEPNCDEGGFIEYWECSDCGKFFNDEKAKNEISDEDLAVDATGHDYVLTYDATNFVYNNVCSNDSSHVVEVSKAGVSAQYAYQVDSAQTMSSVLEREENSKVFVKLTNDIAMDILIVKGKDVELDLNGKNVTNVADHTIYNQGTLVLKDSIGNSVVDNLTHQKAAIFNEQGASLVVDGGTYTRSLENGKTAAASGGNSFYVILNQGDAVVNAGTIKNDGAYSSLVENGWYSPAQNKTGIAANFTINGGTFEGGLYTLKNDDYGVMTINNGQFQNKMPNSTVKNASGIILNWNELSINGGTFIANECNYVVYSGYNGNDTYEKACTTITSGTVKGVVNNGKFGFYQGDKLGTIEGDLEEIDFVVKA